MQLSVRTSVLVGADGSEVVTVPLEEEIVGTPVDPGGGMVGNDVGTSVEPNTDTISLIPAAAYCDFTAARWAAVSVVHSYALSHAPAISQNESMLRARAQPPAKS